MPPSIRHTSLQSDSNKVQQTSEYNLKPDRILQSNPIQASAEPLPTSESIFEMHNLDRKNFFGLNDLFTVEDLLKARVHFGHKEGLLNKHMRPFIFGKRLGVLIIDLDQAAERLRQALNVTAEIAYRNGIIMFVHRSRQTGYLVEEAAKECGEYAYCRRWRNQVFTNSQRLFGAVTRLPDLVILFSTIDMQEPTHKAVKMAAKMLIPTIGICDTNSDPTLITYPVPGNDDTPESIEFYCNAFKTAVLRGKEKRKEILEKYGEDFYYKTLESD